MPRHSTRGLGVPASPHPPQVGTSEQYNVGTKGVANEAEAGGKAASRSQTNTGFQTFFSSPFLLVSLSF